MSRQEEERLQSYLDKIHEIRQMKLMKYEELIERIKKNDEEIARVREKFEAVPAQERIEIVKYTGIVNSFQRQNSGLRILLNIIQALDKEEKRYKEELFKLQAERKMMEHNEDNY